MHSDKELKKLLFVTYLNMKFWQFKWIKNKKINKKEL